MRTTKSKWRPDPKTSLARRPVTDPAWLTKCLHELFDGRPKPIQPGYKLHLQQRGEAIKRPRKLDLSDEALLARSDDEDDQ